MPTTREALVVATEPAALRYDFMFRARGCELNLKLIAGRHRLRDPNRPAFSHPSPQGLGKNLLCGAFAVPHEFVSFDRSGYAHFA
jgi:hypothetical protein